MTMQESDFTLCVTERFADILLILENTVHRVETTGKGNQEQVTKLKEVVEEISRFIEEKVSTLSSLDLLSQIKEMGTQPEKKKLTEEEENQLPQKRERGSIKDPDYYAKHFAKRLNFAERDKAILVAEALDIMSYSLHRSGFLYLSQSNLTKEEGSLYRLMIGQTMPFFLRVDEDLYSQHPDLSRLAERDSWQQLHNYQQQ